MAGFRGSVCSFGRVVSRLLYYILERGELLLLVVGKMSIVCGGVLERFNARQVRHHRKNTTQEEE